MSSSNMVLSRLSENLVAVFGSPLEERTYGGYLMEDATKTKVIYIVGHRIYIGAWWLWQQTEGNIDACVRTFQNWFSTALAELQMKEDDYTELTYSTNGIPEYVFRLDIALTIYQDVETSKPHNGKARREQIYQLIEDAKNMISILSQHNSEKELIIPDSLKVLPFMTTVDKEFGPLY